MPDGLKCLIVVTAGLIPGEPDPKYTRQWSFMGSQYTAMKKGDQTAGMEWNRIMGESREYGAGLENPGLVNWVSRVWTWL
jgi:hypothetical protein